MGMANGVPVIATATGPGTITISAGLSVVPRKPWHRQTVGSPQMHERVALG